MGGSEGLPGRYLVGPSLEAERIETIRYQRRGRCLDRNIEIRSTLGRITGLEGKGGRNKFRYMTGSGWLVWVQWDVVDGWTGMCPLQRMVC